MIFLSEIVFFVCVPPTYINFRVIRKILSYAPIYIYKYYKIGLMEGIYLHLKFAKRLNLEVFFTLKLFPIFVVPTLYQSTKIYKKKLLVPNFNRLLFQFQVFLSPERVKSRLSSPHSFTNTPISNFENSQEATGSGSGNSSSGNSRKK